MTSFSVFNTEAFLNFNCIKLRFSFDIWLTEKVFNGLIIVKR